MLNLKKKYQRKPRLCGVWMEIRKMRGNGRIYNNISKKLHESKDRFGVSRGLDPLHAYMREKIKNTNKKIKFWINICLIFLVVDHFSSFTHKINNKYFC